MTTEARGHDEWLELAALYALGALADDERRLFERHVRGCATCDTEVVQLARVVASLAESVPQVDPPGNLGARVVAAARAASGPESVDDPSRFAHRRVREVAAGAATAPGSVSRTSWLAMAAMIAVIVGVSVYAMSLQRRVTLLEAQLRDAIARAADNLARAETAEDRMVRAERHLAVAAAPGAVRVALAGQAPARQAFGHAEWVRSQGLAVAVASLPPLAPGRTYQVWVLTAGAPVSAGLIAPNAAGDTTAFFSTPPDVPDPVGFALSEEPADGVPAPTGAVYLVGLVSAR